MNHILLIGGLLWTLLLGIWAYRLSAHDLYAEKVWVWLWIAGRLLVRFVLGMALLWAFAAAFQPPEPAYRILIVEADLPQAWDKADTLLHKRYRGIKTGLLAVKGSQTLWILPPTDDPALFRWLREIRPHPTSSPAPESSTPPRFLSQLGPYLPLVCQMVWIGRHPPSQTPENLYLLWCEATPPPKASLPTYYSAGGIPPPERPLSETQIALRLAAGMTFLLLLGDGLMTYILRHNLPLK